MNNSWKVERGLLVRYCRLLAAKGLNAGVDGNVSLRLPGGGGALLVTPSGVRKEAMEEGDLLVVDRSGRVVIEGGGPPTSEIAMHTGVYEARPDLEAVIHAHPPNAVALTMVGVDQSQVWLPEGVFSLGRVVQTPYLPPTTVASARAVAEAMGAEPRQRTDVVVLPLHGVVVGGKSLESAFNQVEALEHIARMLVLAMSTGKEVKPVTGGALEELRMLKEQYLTNRKFSP